MAELILASGDYVADVSPVSRDAHSSSTLTCAPTAPSRRECSVQSSGIVIRRKVHSESPRAVILTIPSLDSGLYETRSCSRRCGAHQGPRAFHRHIRRPTSAASEDKAEGCSENDAAATYRSNIDTFKAKLREAQLRFDREVQMETYNLVAGAGQFRCCDDHE